MKNKNRFPLLLLTLSLTAFSCSTAAFVQAEETVTEDFLMNFKESLIDFWEIVLKEAIKNSRITCSIRVTDESGKGIEGVLLQICDDTTCQVFTTDTAGSVSFDCVPYTWQVHVLMVPEEYEKPETIFETEKNDGELRIILNPVLSNN